MVEEDSLWRCDRCGFFMVERHCKVTCPNCGQRWDCSDLTIWVGDGRRQDERQTGGSRRSTDETTTR